jgi:large subunit ribosomal protein L17
MAMFRNQLASLIQNERIVTTLPKAKELRPLIEKLVTLGKNDSVHARRQAARMIADDGVIGKLFDTLGPRFSTRPGGYTRIIKLGSRRGDAAEMAILEFVGYTLPEEQKSTPATTAVTAPKKARKTEEAEPAGEAASEEKEKPKKKAAAPKKAAPPKKKTKDEDQGKPKKKTSSKKKGKK